VLEPLAVADLLRTNLNTHRLVVVSTNTISFNEPIKSFAALLGKHATHHVSPSATTLPLQPYGGYNYRRHK
jgi:hypothetical protein